MTAADAALLDDPIIAALTDGNRTLAEGGPLAWRYPPDVSPFAAVVERTPRAFDALAALIPRDGRVALTTIEPLPAPPGLAIDLQAPLVQMILDGPIAGRRGGPASIELSAADVPRMLDLTARTRPGPFGPRTIEFGRYVGIEVDGTLAAMAGERMRFGRFVEISAVCVDPAHRGHGYADVLMTRLAQDLEARGLTPILHVFATNTGAIRLYEKLGFVARRALTINGLRVARGAPPSGADAPTVADAPTSTGAV